MRAPVLLALALWAGAALADHHAWVAGDALEVGQRYTLERSETPLLNAPAAPMAGVILLPWRKLTKVYERRMVGGELWYYVQAPLLRAGEESPLGGRYRCEYERRCLQSRRNWRRHARSGHPDWRILRTL